MSKLTPEISYVPTLRWLTGERRALQKDVTVKTKALIKPLIEIPPRGEKHDEPNASDELMNALTPEAYLQALPLNIVHHWGFTPFLLDTYFMATSEKEYNGRDSLAFLCDRLNLDHAHPIPVLRLDEPDAQAREVKPHVQSGIAVRLGVGALARTSDITSLIKLAGATVETTDIILDLGYLSDDSIAATQVLLQQPLLAKFARSRDWRSLTLLGGSFPPSLSGRKPGLHEVERREWVLWREAIERVERRMLFGDYTVTYPKPEPVTGETRGAIPCIRYTDEEQWLLFRGAGKSVAAAGGNKQYYELARNCRAHDAYRGRKYSTGDLYIDDCANKDEGPGNPTTWRRVATSTHITYAANQAASACDSAGGL